MAEVSERPASRSLPAGAELLVSAKEITAALDGLAEKIQPFIDERPCILLGVMLGGLLPTAWLVQRLSGDYQLDYCHITRYQGSQRGAEPVWLRPPGAVLKAQHVLVIDDIYDEGITQAYVKRECESAGAHRVTSVALVRKCHDRAAGREPADLVGLEVPDRYVFGCGMDLAHRWRHLNAIYALQEGC